MVLIVFQWSRLVLYHPSFETTFLLPPHKGQGTFEQNWSDK